VNRYGAPLPPAFYDRDAAVVARDLLGGVLRHETSDGVISGRIVETEAYLGPHDPASHSAVGRTARTWHMFGPPGTAYVYFIYGMHWCVNAVTGADGYGAAVLIRAVVPLEGVALMRARRPKARRDRDLASGPGKVCAAFGITREHDGVRLTGASALSICSGEVVPDDLVEAGPRVGISKAVEWPLRFVVRGE
jgi:DNA-3-methyladenine glycosylase